MKVSRNFSIVVQFFLDELVPPIVRDSRLFMHLPMRFVLGKSAYDFMNFKDWVFVGSEKDFSRLYDNNVKTRIQGETDLNERCLKEIVSSINNKNVLEVGCGEGFLAEKLAVNNTVTGCDLVIDKDDAARYPNVKFVKGNAEKLPFKDKSFDVVVTTHTLEHVRDLGRAVSELKRVARQRVVIVVPRQRPYKYTFSLHTQFFPYRWSLENAFGYIKGKTTIKNLGDWYYSHKLGS